MDLRDAPSRMTAHRTRVGFPRFRMGPDGHSRSRALPAVQRRAILSTGNPQAGARHSCTELSRPKPGNLRQRPFARKARIPALRPWSATVQVRVLSLGPRVLAPPPRVFPQRPMVLLPGPKVFPGENRFGAERPRVWKPFPGLVRCVPGLNCRTPRLGRQGNGLAGSIPTLVRSATRQAPARPRLGRRNPGQERSSQGLGSERPNLGDRYDPVTGRTLRKNSGTRRPRVGNSAEEGWGIPGVFAAQQRRRPVATCIRFCVSSVTAPSPA